ncbi:MAG: glycosyltransferase family 9 protein [Deltaproteobacteria bacterium]|nr:glycosyltransferase family 9 protein [Deltaproteobacteria bacterium]
MRRRHKGASVDRVLIMKFSGIGSLACAYPALLTLKKNYPDASLAFWGTRHTASIAKEFGIFSKIVILDDRTLLRSAVSLIRDLPEIWSFRPTWAFDLEIYSKLSSLFCLWTVALNRVGFISDTTRFRKYLHTHLIYFNRFRYVGDLYHQIFLDTLPMKAIPSSDLAIELGINTRPRKLDKIVININSGELSPMRKWPRESFHSLILKLLEFYQFEIVLTGSSQDYGHVEGMTGMLPAWAKSKVRNACGEYDLRGFMGILRGCRLMITVDSGPMHLAVLMGTPIVALFGPTHPCHFLPSCRKDTVAIYHNFICSPCVHVIDDECLPCAGTAPCMSSISVEEVLAEASALLENSEKEKIIERPVYGSAKTYSRE